MRNFLVNPIRKLSRLFKSNPRNDFLSELYSKTSKPLFVHPQLGKSLIDSYLRMGNSAEIEQSNGDGLGSSVGVIIQEGIAVLDISGSLVDREMVVPCAQSPVSYEAIKMEMELLLENSDITTIIARLDTPGGVASQNMDLSDFIYNSRGKGKKLIAVVDDMAYSAGFGIASAFEEIWISRTGGVGSVGVVSYHEDHSKYLAKQGIKVEYIYAGDKKVFGNPAEPLSDEARTDFQNEVSRLYDIFTETVARNLSMTVADVRETQAGTFHGKKAIEAGFAHKLGTFDDVLQSLFDDEEQISENKEIKMLKDNEENKQEGSEGLESTDEMIDESLTDDTGDGVDVTDVVDNEQEAENAYKASIEGICMVAGVSPEATQKFIDAKMSVADVRENLMALTSNPTNQVSNTEKVNLVANQKAKIDESWDNAFK